MVDIEEILKKNNNTSKWLKGFVWQNFSNNNGKDLSINDCIQNCISPVKTNDNSISDEEKILTVFKSLTLFEPKDTKILIIGQDPYPKSERADGLAFSFANKAKADDSLLNIFKAVKAYKSDRAFDDISKNEITGVNNENDRWNTNLEKWSENNKILLLNTALTYDKKNTIDERIKAWQPFTIHIIRNLLNSKSDEDSKLAVFLWGVKAQKLFYDAIENNDELNKYIGSKAEFEISQGEFGKILTRGYYKNTNVIIFLSSHPSNQGVRKGFKDDAAEHFRICDEFSDKIIWKIFPEKQA